MNEQNLKPFKKGQSGNPKGKPKGTVSITTHLKRLMNKKISVPELTGSDDKLTVKELIALRLIKDAIDGKHHAQNIILERLEGKVTQKVEQNTTVVDMPSIYIDGVELEFDVGEKVNKEGEMG